MLYFIVLVQVIRRLSVYYYSFYVYFIGNSFTHWLFPLISYSTPQLSPSLSKVQSTTKLSRLENLLLCAIL